MLSLFLLICVFGFFLLSVSSDPQASDTNCVRSNTAIAGYDVAPGIADVGDIDACNARCKANSKCVYFTYRSADATCFLKSAAGYLTASALSGYTTGSANCKFSCFIDGFNLAGNDIKLVSGISSASGCQSACVGIPDCKYFTYQSGAGNCYVKQGSAGMIGSPDGRFVSGPRACGLPTTTKCLMEDVYMPVATYKNFTSIPSSYECQGLCNDDNPCAYFSYHTVTSVCELKTPSARLYARGYSGYVSGPKNCQVEGDSCLLYGVNLPGNDITKVTTASSSACQSSCNSNWQCAAFSFSPSDGSCYLKTGNARGSTTKDNFISGPSTCRVTAPGQCWRNDLAFSGFDIGSPDVVDNAAACSMRCDSNAKCFYFTYRQSDRICFLKDVRALPTRAAMDGHVSGGKNCWQSDCWQTNYNMPGNDVGYLVNIASTTDCQTSCGSDDDCFFFSYLPTEKKCYLKNKAAVFTSTPYAPFVSGQKFCKFPTSTDCLFHDTTLPGHSVGSVDDVESPHDCASLCNQNDKCMFFSYSSGNKTCEFKSKEARLRPVPALLTISGPKNCETDRCYNSGVNLPGNDIRSVAKISSSVLCQAECSKEPKCRFFSYSGIEGRCYLKTSDASQTSVTDGSYISGPSSCRLKALSACTRAGVSLVNYNTASSVTATPEECHVSCGNDAACAYYSYRLSSRVCTLKATHSLLAAASADGFVSGSKDCNWDDCFVLSTNMPSNDIRRIDEVPSPEDCQRRCAEHPDCYFFSFNGGYRQCYMKTYGALYTATPYSGFVSGPRVCGVNVTDCLQHETIYLGGDVAVEHPVPSATECMASCTALDTCFFFTYHTAEAACHLKGMSARLAAYVARGYVSGPKYCGAPDCSLHATNLLGGDIGKMADVENSRICVDECIKEVRCAYISYSLSSRVCYLKSADALSGAATDSSYISAPRSCQPLVPPPTCFKNTNRPGHDIVVLDDTTGPAACQSRCLARSDCLYFTYRTSVRRCWLKSGGDDSLEYSDDDHTSGPRVCPVGTQTTEQPSAIPTTAPGGCIYPNTGFGGAGLVGKKSGFYVAAQCQLLCTTTVGCVVFSFVSADRVCLLTDGVGKYTTEHGTLSGPRDCSAIVATSTTTASDIPTTAPPSCFFDNINMPGDDLTRLSAPNPAACQIACVMEAGCHFFTWARQTHTCYLKGERGAANAYVDSESVSGPRACEVFSTTSPPPPSTSTSSLQRPCGVKDTDIPGNDLAIIFDRQTPDDCQAACVERKFCAFFSYAPQGVCYLKAASVSTRLAVGYWSGPRVCDRAVEIPPSAPVPTTAFARCILPHTNSPGYDVAFRTSVSSVEECQTVCSRMDACQFFSYDITYLVCYLKTEAAEPLEANMSYTSGFKSCGRPPMTTTPVPTTSTYRRSCWISGIDYPGNDYMINLTATTPDECQDICHSDVNCAYFVFFMRSNVCYLKSLDSSGTAEPAEWFFAGGPRTC